MVGTGYVGGIRRRTILASLPVPTLSYSHEDLAWVRFCRIFDCLYRGRTSFSTMFFLSFESEIPVAWQRGSELPPSGRAKQEQFGAMQGNKIARRMTRCPAINSNHEVIREGTSSSSRLP